MKISTIMFIIAVILSTSDIIITAITENEIIKRILQCIIWSCLGAGWTLIFLGY